MKIEKAHIQTLNSVKFKEGLQDILDLVSFSDNKLHDSVWAINTAQGELKLDFLKLKQRFLSVDGWNALRADHVLMLIKTVFLESASSFQNKNLIRQIFFGLYKTYYYFALNGESEITREELDDYFDFVLTRAISDGDLVRSARPIYLHKSAADLLAWNRVLLTYGFSPIIDETINPLILDRALELSIPRLTRGDLTYVDWRAGIGLNTLTLDYGGFYTDHCIGFFRRHISMATALNITMSEGKKIMKDIGLNINQSSYDREFRPLITQCLQGASVESIVRSRGCKRKSDRLIKEIISSVRSYYINEYLRIERYHYSYNRQTIEETCSYFGGDATDENVGFLQQLVKIELAGLEVSAALKQKLLNICPKAQSLASFMGRLDQVASEYALTLNPEVPNIDFYKSIGVENTATGKFPTYVRDLIVKVRNAGQVAALAFTGWRGSEMNYCLQQISAELNLDILDSDINPIRYQIMGNIPKTHGETPALREVTERVFDISISLGKLNLCVDGEPLLFIRAPGKVRAASSFGHHYKRYISDMWKNFVEHYPPFVELEKSLSLKGDQKMDLDERRRIKSGNLYRTFKRVRAELELVETLTSTGNSLVARLRDDSLSKKTKDLISSRLPASIFENMNSDDLDEKSKAYARRRASIEIIRTTLRPTPHAFRHMWAEAVYRRFDGDVGWAIRSNFKHISPNMWLEYVKDKDSQNERQKVKLAVISSLLKNYVGHQGDGYAGAIDTVMRRLIANTKITDVSKLAYYADKFASDEIEDIKATPWGFCLLRVRHKRSAKCAQEGVPIRSKASPELCMGCINNLATSSNIEGILLSTANDLKVLNTPNMPTLFLKKSRKTVKLALSYLKKLKADSSVINVYQSALAHKGA